MACYVHQVGVLWEVVFPEYSVKATSSHLAIDLMVLLEEEPNEETFASWAVPSTGQALEKALALAPTATVTRCSVPRNPDRTTRVLPRK